MENKSISILTTFAMLTLMSSCELNDIVDNVALVGRTASNVYWEVPSAVVSAGDSVEFTAQYWTPDNKINYIGVWYDINRSMNYSLTYTGLYNINYTYSKDSVQNVREFQEIANYTKMHAENLWVDSLRAYVFKYRFPVSYTLLGTEIKDPSDLETVNNTINRHVPEYMQTAFKINLAPMLLVDAVNVDVSSQPKFEAGLINRNLFNLIVVNNHLTDTTRYLSYFEIYFNENSGRNESRIKIKESANYTDTLSTFIRNLPISKLIYNNTKVAYQVQYSNQYKLNSRFKVVNANNADNYSFIKEITVR